MSTESNVFFLAIVRMDEQPIFLASYGKGSPVNVTDIKSVLKKQGTIVGKHNSFSVGQFSWHLLADELQLIYLVICKLSYPQRCAHQCTEELQRMFIAQYRDKVFSTKEGILNKQCEDLLAKLTRKYDNLTDIDKISTVSQKIDSVKVVMHENINTAIQNCVKLESIEVQSEELLQNTAIFKDNTTRLRRKMWFKNIQMKLILCFKNR